jgi:hypothetical protein
MIGSMRFWDCLKMATGMESFDDVASNKKRSKKEATIMLTPSLRNRKIREGSLL